MHEQRQTKGRLQARALDNGTIKGNGATGSEAYLSVLRRACQSMPWLLAHHSVPVAPSVRAATGNCSRVQRIGSQVLHDACLFAARGRYFEPNSKISVSDYIVGSTGVICKTASKASKRISAATAASAHSKVHLSCMRWSKHQLNAQRYCLHVAKRQSSCRVPS